MNSALYAGIVRHRRFSPTKNAFTYRVAMLYVDLAEARDLFRLPGLFSYERPGLYAFRRRDYLGDPSRPLDACVRDAAAAVLGRRPEGAVRMLTMVSALGFCFNPVTFYYCFQGPRGGGGEDVLEAIVAEITNTPWKERHAYVLPCRGGRGAESAVLRKAFHVSPFMPMDQRYRWRFTAPGETLAVHMETFPSPAGLPPAGPPGPGAGRAPFDATLSLRRLPWSAPNVCRVMAAYPFMTFKAVALIHWQALKLWAKGTPSFRHPRGEGAPA